MPYIKEYRGYAPTGRTLEYVYKDLDGTEVREPYPEEAPVHEIVWQTPWQPEHAPVGSVVRYESSGKKELNQVTVTGHYWNGPQSWIILTDDVCPILGGDSKASFNGSWLREIVSRGDGGVYFRNDLDARKWATDEYLRTQKELPAGFKRPGQYASTSPHNIIRYVLSTHPSFAYVGGPDMHIYNYIDDIVAAAVDRFDCAQLVGNYYCGYRINKKKLVKLLKRLIARTKLPRARLQKESDDLDREIMDRDMENDMGLDD